MPTGEVHHLTMIVNSLAPRRAQKYPGLGSFQAYPVDTPTYYLFVVLRLPYALGEGAEASYKPR